MKRISPKPFPLPVAVCLLLLLAFSVVGFAQSKGSAKKRPQADKTLSSEGAPTVVTVAPKSAAKSAPAKSAPAPAVAAANAPASFMSATEQEIIAEMNLARTNPQEYAKFVEEFKTYYEGNRLKIPGRAKAISTFDGIAAVDEAVNFLRSQKSLPPLEAVKGMCLAAREHAADLADKGLTGHRGSDGSMPNARVDRYGVWEGTIGETVAYEISTARQLVISLIIDDGVPNRGHRRNIFDPSYTVAGVGIKDSSANGLRCVVDYAGGFKEKEAGQR